MGAVFTCLLSSTTDLDLTYPIWNLLAAPFSRHIKDGKCNFDFFDFFNLIDPLKFFLYAL